MKSVAGDEGDREGIVRIPLVTGTTGRRRTRRRVLHTKNKTNKQTATVGRGDGTGSDYRETKRRRRGLGETKARQQKLQQY